MAIGHSGGAYATLTPPRENYIGDALKDVEDNGFKYRAEKRLVDDKEEAARKANEVKDDFDPKVEFTGNKSINDLSIPFAMQSAQQYSENVRQINATTDPAERTRLLQANNRLKQNFDTYAQIPKIINAKMAEITKGVEDGKLSPRDAERAAHLFDGLNNGKAKVTIDPYGVARLTTFKVTPTGELELDANGKPIAIAENQDVAALMKSFEVHAKSDYDKSILENTSKFKLDTNTYERGGNKYTKEVKDKRTDDAANAYALGVVSQPHERFELSQRTGIPENDTEKLKQYVAKSFKDKIAEVDEQTHNYAADTNARENRKEKQEQIQIGTPTYTTNEGGERDGVKLPKDTYVVPVANAQRKVSANRTIDVKEIRVLPNGQVQIAVDDNFTGESVSKKVPNERGLQKLNEYYDVKGKKVKNTIDDLNPDTDFETVSTSEKKLTPITYKSGGSDSANNEIGRIALLLPNPESKNGRNFTGAKQLIDYYRRQSGYSPNKKEESKKRKIDY